MTTANRTCALYLRVSTSDQSVENQRPELLRVADARGMEIVEVYEENVSATKRRPMFEAMQHAAHRGKFEVLIVWSLDRLGRSMIDNLGVVLDLDRVGVEVISVKESWLQMAGPVRTLLIGVLSWVAEQERCRIAERTKAGLERARRKGRQLGRPRKRVDMVHALQLRAQGYSIRQIAKRLRVGSSTLHRLLREDQLQAVATEAVPETGTQSAA